MLDQVFGWLDNSIGVTSPRAAQYLEFHALRTGYIAGLALAGVTPAMAQKRARRSDNNLKLGKYTRLQIIDLTGSSGKPPNSALPLSRHNQSATHEPAIEEATSRTTLPIV